MIWKLMPSSMVVLGGSVMAACGGGACEPACPTPARFWVVARNLAAISPLSIDALLLGSAGSIGQGADRVTTGPGEEL